MEEKEGLNEAPHSFRVEPRVENPDPFGGSTAPPPPAAAPVTAPPSSSEVKKKRGRPRKYAGDSSVVALSPMPISASIPLTGDYSAAWKHNTTKPVDSSKKKHKLDFGSPGEPMAYSVGGSFLPHVITVNAGEDINMKIISFSQQGSRAICILAANGAISNVTLRQSNSSVVVIGSFPTGHQQEQKPKKPKYEQTITFGPANPISKKDMKRHTAYQSRILRLPFLSMETT
ncbi:hypothetical protein DH2020_044330 [Rehmannia glutinosa]|uniref:AT-hook motif nuclear-localized protein n=1 Tax=Rehmannia glutinosa TaxID=99300 RepID=A0ABR0UH89_REHGL